MKSLLFKKEMFNQIISGKKTETRRIINKIFKNNEKVNTNWFFHHEANNNFIKTKDAYFLPRYYKNEIIYLKEPYQFNYHLIHEDLNYEQTRKDIVYKFDNNVSTSEMLEEKWKNKLFMPEKFARYYIQITDIKVQKLHDITGQDAINEGIELSEPFELGYKNYMDDNIVYRKQKVYDGKSGAVMSFLSLWQKIHKVEDVLKINPYVFVYKFKQISI
jgi:hypothetical protein